MIPLHHLKRHLVISFKIVSIYIFLLSFLTYNPHVSNEAHADYSSIDTQQNCITQDSEDNSSSNEDKSKSNKDKDSDNSDSDVPNKENIKAIYDFLHNKHGFSGEFIAGILGNWAVESHIDPTSNEPMNSGVESAKKATNGDLGIGYGQWTAERHHALVKWAKKKDEDWWKTDIQLDFMVTGDDGFKEKLKDLALSSGDDPVEETIKFHSDWEISADSETEVKENRGGKTKKIWNYMKENGMDGKKDTDKIKKMEGDSKDTKGASSTDNSNEEVTTDYCGEEKSDNSSKSSGKLGESTKVNGNKGKTITKNYEYDDLPEKYKKHIKIPKFDEKYLKGSTFPRFGDEGQCTELTWAYMNQMHGKGQPSDDGSVTNGNRVYEVYKKKGAKVTDKPTVGYGFSSDPPQAGAADPTVGHTGVVAGVMDDGKWIMASYNLPPNPAPSRTLYYTVIDGTDGDIKFFSGIKGSKK